MLRVIGLVAVVASAAVAMSANEASAFRNPASVFCINSGGKSEIRNGPRGQYVNPPGSPRYHHVITCAIFTR